MKILHVTPAYFADVSLIGGGERYVNNACKALNLQESVIRSDILSFGPSAASTTLFPKTKIHLAAGASNPLVDIDPLARSNFRDYLEEYDVIHVHQCLTHFGLFVASHARLLGKQVVGTDHGGGETLLFRAHPFLFGNFDVLHAQSAFARFAFMEAAQGSRLIRGPVDDDAHDLAASQEREPELFIAIGRLLPHKGMENLIDCLPPECKLVIVGRAYDGEYLRFLESRIGSKSVEIATTLDDSALSDLMRRAGLCLHATVDCDYRGQKYLKAELLGLAPLEAMCTGLPVICSQTAALRELGGLAGCRTFRGNVQLAALLRQYLDGQLRFPEAYLIRRDAIEHYGLLQFGREYVAALEAPVSCAS